MSWKFWKKDEPIEEALKPFENKGEKVSDKFVERTTGEGFENISDSSYGVTSLSSFNTFYKDFINREHKSEKEKIKRYREMADMPEVADVIEDAVNESITEDDEGNIVTLHIKNEEMEKNKNIVNTLTEEFNDLFYNRIKIGQIFDQMFYTYMVDGRLFFEKIIDSKKSKNGILSLKILPSETMDFTYNIKDGKPTAFYQYLTSKATRPKTFEEAESDPNIVAFHPEQIGFINYGLYGKNRNDIKGYLEKAKVPYNQLKLLETSVIIYRIVRAPERFVFRIDTGNMPKDKSMKFVNKIKTKLTKRQTYDVSTGRLSQDTNVMGIVENFFLPQSADGRGSQIDTIGGNATGFTELDDIYYFARKLYRALKYPQSRVTAQQEKQEREILFGGQSVGEISRDEVKWAKFLEKQQRKFTREFKDLFLLHLDFKGLKAEYELTKNDISVKMEPPSDYKEQMKQNFYESRFNNYQMMADRPEMSKYYLMKKFLKMTDEEIDANVEGFKKDKEYGFKEEEGGMF